MAWKRGESGNKKGRPKNIRITKREQLTVARNLVRRAMRGNASLTAIRMFYEFLGPSIPDAPKAKANAPNLEILTNTELEVLDFLQRKLSGRLKPGETLPLPLPIPADNEDDDQPDQEQDENELQRITPSDRSTPAVANAPAAQESQEMASQDRLLEPIPSLDVLRRKSPWRVPDERIVN
jgi:hypothetical protein